MVSKYKLNDMTNKKWNEPKGKPSFSDIPVKIYHRKYPDSQWDYRGISTRVDNKEIVYYTVKDKGKFREGVEVYSGYNYDIHSTARSHSNAYTISNFPKKYQSIVSNLKSIHRQTKWSNKKYVNLS